jgi:hypothetical protein
MKSTSKFAMKYIPLLVVLVLLSMTWGSARSSSEASPLGSGFTYQGYLEDSAGHPINGDCDFIFRLWDAESGGAQVGSDSPAGAINVAKGYFTALLNASGEFGSAAFKGDARWLSVSLRCPAGSGTYTTLTPRQPLTAAPYAISLKPGAQITGQVANGNGLSATNTTTSGYGFGIKGQTDAIQGAGVYGYASASGGDVYGVYGVSNSASGYGGVFVGNTGIYARSTGGNPIVAYGSDFSDREFYVSNTGEVYADGTFHPSGADFAEMLPAVEGLQPGDVLVIGLDGKLALSDSAYQPNVVGVYSTQPGFIGGAADGADLTGKVPLAVAGVVLVKANAENGAIQPGDLLTTSSTPGYAMRCASIELCYGRAIGKALEGLKSGTGLILVLVMPH